MCISGKRVRELLAYLVCEQGRPIGKEIISEKIWQDAKPKQAMDSLYKTCRKIRILADQGIYIPIISEMGSLYLDRDKVACDLWEFTELCEQKGDIKAWEDAEKLYKGFLFGDERFHWMREFIGKYDTMYIELLEALTDYYIASGDKGKAGYYKKKMDYYL